MEDSYTVHRRRKAAARKREKTPEPPRRNQEDVADDEEDARARMERMVQETERLEALEETARQREIEKSGERVEKSQRVLKRAMSPEVRRKEDDINEKEDNFEGQAKVEVLTLGVRSSSDKLKVFRDGTTKKTSGVGEDQTEEFGAEVTVKLKEDTAPEIRSFKRRTEVDTDYSADITEKPVRSVKKAVSPDKLEKSRSDVAVDEWSKSSGSTARSRRTPSRMSDKEDEEEAAAALDKNRYEATRESDGATRVNNAGKIDNAQNEDQKKNVEEKMKSRVEDLSEKNSRPLEDEVKNRKREIISPSKTRNSESRGMIKRTTENRNIEKIGYTTDSSDAEENSKRVLRRKKSPEGAKARSSSSRKTPSRSRVTTDTDGDVEDLERIKKTEKRSVSRRRRSSDTDEDKRKEPRAPSRNLDKSRSGEKRSSSRVKIPSDAEIDTKSAMRKSGSFPADRPRDKSPSISRSSIDMRKQIIPLSDDSLIEDFERAQQDYLRKVRGILDNDPLDDDYIDPKMEAALRRRKFSIVQTEVLIKEVDQPKKRSWFGWVGFFGKKEKTDEKEEVKSPKEVKGEKSEKFVEVPKEEKPNDKKVSLLEFFRTLAHFLSEFKAFVEQNPRETRNIRILRNRCIAELLLAIIYCGLGAFIFRFTEGAFETFYKCGVKRVKRDFLDSLWNFSHNMREEDWKSMARRKLMEFEEQLHTAHEAGVHSYSGQKSWSFLNAVVYCLTVITTIGYGHISPSTTTGRAITIVYAIFGIPMFLIILADFGKLFTRGIKFLWAFVRRVYYTGSCRRVRRTGPVQEVMKGVQLVYDLATFRRPSQMNPEELEEMQKQQNQTQTVLNVDGNVPPTGVPPDTPGTPAMSSFEIDDEFNLPISVAIFILLVYIFVGATVYNIWEEWGFFESFYFVFISMSTIGFGDYVPKHPIYMMLSIVYLVFGLALTSMCINVVQVMLSDSFKQASQKIGATIGFEVAEEDGTGEPASSDPVEVADVQINESGNKEQIAPKAKQEDVEL